MTASTTLGQPVQCRHPEPGASSSPCPHPRWLALGTRCVFLLPSVPALSPSALHARLPGKRGCVWDLQEPRGSSGRVGFCRSAWAPGGLQRDPVQPGVCIGTRSIFVDFLGFGNSPATFTRDAVLGNVPPPKTWEPEGRRRRRASVPCRRLGPTPCRAAPAREPAAGLSAAQGSGQAALPPLTSVPAPRAPEPAESGLCPSCGVPCVCPSVTTESLSLHCPPAS